LYFDELLRTTACNASRVLAIVEVSVRLSVHLSHPGTVSKRRHLESRNLQMRPSKWSTL